MKSKYKLKISGKNNDYFIHLLISKGIQIYSLEKHKGYIVIIIDWDDYKKIKKIKTSYKINVIRSYGFINIREVIKRNLSFILSFFVCLLLLIFFSNLIFNIEIVSSNNSLKKIILEDLKVRGIYRFQLKKSYSERNRIVKEIINEEKDTIEWMDIDCSGTKYIVSVVERVKNDEEDICSPSNVVAKKDAFILEINATSGEVLTALNRSVKKGDILISGNIYNKEEVVSTRCARGKVFGEVWYQVYVDLPKHYREENVTGRSSKSLGFEFFNYKSKSNYKTYKSKVFNILNNKILPIRFFYTKYLETEVIEKEFNIDNVDSYALEKAEAKLRDKLGKEDEILLKKILKKEEKESRIIIGAFFKVKEDITMIEEIPENLEQDEE